MNKKIKIRRSVTYQNNVDKRFQRLAIFLVEIKKMLNFTGNIFFK